MAGAYPEESSVMSLKAALHAFSLLSLMMSSAFAADTPSTNPGTPPATKPKAPPMPPTEANVRYGPHERNVLDFYQAKSAKPTPLVFYIHGGGWTTGDKHNLASPANYLAAGISVVSINYRYISQAADVTPPVKPSRSTMLRALCSSSAPRPKNGTLTSSASARAAVLLALAPRSGSRFTTILRVPKSDDPLARESTRLWCVAVSSAQTTLDPKQMKEWTPNSGYGGHAFGFNASPANKTSRFAEFLGGREKILPWLAEYSPYALLTADDPPVYLIYPRPPALGKNQKDPTHTSNFGVKLQEHCKEIGVECEYVYPGAPDVKHPRMDKYIIEALKAPSAKSVTAK